MKVDLKNVKTCVFGIQGSGKTYLTANSLLKNFKHPFIYEIHPEDFRHVKNAIIYEYTQNSLSVENLNKVCLQVKEMGKKKQIDAFVLDEADMFIQSTLSIPQNLRDLILNHRHYGLALIFISRRPQSIPTEVVESSEHLFIFKIEGDNVYRKFNAIHPKIVELMKYVRKDSHNFIYKKLGEEPKLMNGIQLNKHGGNNFGRPWRKTDADNR